MRRRPAVSVLLPVRNAAVTLAECLLSVRTQTLEDFEVVAVDDGSTDGTPEILAELARDDRRIRIITRPPLGLVDALNEGLRVCSADLIARMDADDRMHPERLEAQRRAMEADPSVGVVGTQVELFSDSEIFEGSREYVRWQNRCLTPDEIAANMYVESPLAHPSVMIRRRVFETVGSYRNGRFPEDYELWLRCHAAGIRFSKVPRVLLYWRDSPARASRTDDRYARDAFDRLRSKFLARDPRLHGARSIVIWGAGYKTRRRTRLLLEKGIEIDAWVDIDPRKVGSRLWDRPVHPPQWLAGRDKPFVLIYVTNHGAREEIGAALDGMGYFSGRDYIAVG